MLSPLALQRNGLWKLPAPLVRGLSSSAAKLAREELAERPNALYGDLKQKFGHVGAVNHKQVGVWDLFAILRGVRSKRDLSYGLQAMNLFYNFGVKLKHREISTRLLAATMMAREESEAIELIKLYGTWLEHPPDSAIVYAVMSKFLDDNKPTEVRELAKVVREDWRFRLQAPLYSLAIQAMLQLPNEQHPLEAAMILRQDAVHMGVRLPVKVQLQLLNKSLEGSLEWQVPKAVNQPPTVADEEPEAAEGDAAEAPEPNESEPSESPESSGLADHLKNAVSLADALAQDGHVRAGASSATLCSVSWLLWHLAALSPEQRQELVDSPWINDLTWSSALELACGTFHSQVGFSSQLPRGFFHTLEAAETPEAQHMVEICRRCFGRFYPS